MSENKKIRVPATPPNLILKSHSKINNTHPGDRPKKLYIMENTLDHRMSKTQDLVSNCVLDQVITPS